MTQRIKKFRLELGMSQQELSRRTGLTQPAISGLETGKRRFQVNELQLVADALGRHELDLLPRSMVAELQDDVEAEEPPGEAAIRDALVAKKLKHYKVLTDVVSGAGIVAGQAVVGDTSDEAISTIETGRLVIAAVSVAEENVDVLVLRQYLKGGILTTNRSGRNASFNVNDPDYTVHTVAVIITPTTKG